MASLNKVMIIGRLGRDPEMRYLPNGHAVTNFSVAVGRRIRPPDGGEWREETEWFNVVAFERLAETCNQYLQKGKQVYIEGRLQSRSWDGQDGQKHYRTEVIANGMQMLDARDRQAEPAPVPAGDDFDQSPAAGKEEELPF